MLEEPDPERQLRLNARNSRAVKVRIGGRHRGDPHRRALDPDIDALWSRIQADYHANQGAIVESLQRRARSTRLSTSTRAADILWTINHPTVWHLLVGARGWTADEYEQWSADTACEQLLGRNPESGKAPHVRGFPVADL